MARTDITEAILSSGQNEGVERSVLPLPQLAYVQNARQRKSGRWGKRFGTAAITTTNRSGATLGNGDGLARAIGPGFAIVDDTCSVYDRQAATWNVASATVAKYSDPAAAFPTNPRIPGAVSGWLPGSAYYPVPPASLLNQSVASCASAYFLGYLWSAIEIVDPASSPNHMIRVVATNQTDQALAFLFDLRDVAASIQYPRLIACGTRLVLVYVDGSNIKARTLTTIAGGFSASTTLETGFSLTNASAPGAQIGFDAAPMTTDHTVFLLATTLPAAINLKVVNAAALTVTNSIALAPVTSGGGGPTVGTSVSIIGDAQGVNGRIWVTYGSFQTGTLEKQTKVAVYNGNLAALIAAATLASAAIGNANYTQSYATVISGQKVRVVFGSAFTGGAANLPQFSFADVNNAGAISSAITFRQQRFLPLSRPFTIGSRVYLWATTTDVLSVFGYATLLRLPSDSEPVAPLTFTLADINCPLELSAQDFLISTSTVDQLGLPSVVELGTTAQYTFIAPTLGSLGTPNQHDFRVIQLSHYSDLASARGVLPVSADGVNFAPLGTLTRLDAIGATEVGFALLPIVYGLVAGAGGALTASTTYEYTAIYVAKNANGRTELSAPSPPVKIALGAGQTKVTLNVAVLEVGSRAMCQIQIYRTLSNGTVFYLLDTIDGSEGSGATLSQTYVDTASDSSISANQVLYTQVGQTLPNAFPPPSRFAVVGGQRVWLGGLLRNDVVHCSKLMLGDQSPTWCDNDAFRVVMPAAVTGMAWMDQLLVFTAEGVYVVSGDGPDDSGTGSFAAPVRLPFALGCIEPRSVITVDEGTFFQTSRGIYMVPRGFGSPIPAGDMVLDSLAQYPVITGVSALMKATEQTIRFSCMETRFFSGIQIVYDIAHKCWSVDALTDPAFTNNFTGACAVGPWIDGETAMAVSVTPLEFMVSNSSYSDSGNAIAMQIQTGDLRPFGTMSEGVISKVDTMVELRSAPCTLTVTKTTEWGTSPGAARVFAAAAGDTQPGQKSYVETELGVAELRDAVSLALRWDESSVAEGLAFVAIAIEHEQSEGLKRVSPLSRAT